MALAALLRLALLPTVLWDFLIGMWLIGQWRFSGDGLALLSLLCLYHGGMALNDWRDRAQDRAVGRPRPLADGRLKPAIGAAVALGLLALGSFAGLQANPGTAAAVPWLLCVILIYDLLGPSLRGYIGPALLAIARAMSLAWPMMAVGGLAATLEPTRFAALACYAIFFLALSRLAQREEVGVLGMRALAMYLAAALTPLLLAEGASGNWWWLLPWLLFAAYLLPPAWRLRHQQASPDQVQGLVRHGLSAAPLLLGVIALAHEPSLGGALLVAAAPLILLSVRLLASLLPPE